MSLSLIAWEAADAGAVEADALGEHVLVEPAQWDAEVLPGPRQVDEAKVDDLDARLTRLLQHLGGTGLGRPLNFDCHHASSQGGFVLVTR